MTVRGYVGFDEEGTVVGSLLGAYDGVKVGSSVGAIVGTTLGAFTVLPLGEIEIVLPRPCSLHLGPDQLNVPLVLSADG